jgi:hypothetical protein
MEARSQSEPATEGEESQHRAEKLAVEQNAGHYEPDSKIRWRPECQYPAMRPPPELF